MLKQLLALSLFFVFSSEAMHQESPDDNIGIFSLSLNDKTVDQTFAHDDHDDSEAIVTEITHMPKATLLRMSGDCLREIRQNALAGEPNTETVERLRAINKQLQAAAANNTVAHDCN